jgi:hypothetical protein
VRFHSENTRPISVIWAVRCKIKKFFAFALPQISSTFAPVPAQSQGAFRDRHERWARDAMDAFLPNDERRERRTAKSCGPDIPMLMPSWRRCFRYLSQ